MRGAALFFVILCWGIATLWVPGRWALAGFQVALFVLAGVSVFVRQESGFRIHPVAITLAGCVAWGLAQIVFGWTVEGSRTVEAVLGWTANAVAFSLGVDLLREPARRERVLHLLLWFGLVVAVLAIFTGLTSPIGRVFWTFDMGTDSPTFGPFVYRNQFAAFVELLLPLALVRAILDRRRWVPYTIASAVLFGSVVAAGSRAGSILCLGEIVVVPLLIFARRLISGKTLARVLAGSLGAAALLTAIVGWEFVWKRLQEPNPYALRRELVLSSVEMVRDRPVTGFGLGTWSAAYPAYAHFDDGRFVNQAHNDWVQWAAEGGMPFFLVLLGIAVWSVRPALRSLWGVGWLVVLVHCTVDYPMQQRPALAAFFFAMLGAVAAQGRPDKVGETLDRATP